MRRLERRRGDVDGRGNRVQSAREFVFSRLRRDIADRERVVGISMAALTRQGIDALLSQHNEPSLEEMYQRAARAAGAYHSGTRDTASRHDDYLAEEFLR